MKQLILIMMFLFVGCQPLSPRFSQKLDNSNGKVDEIKNNQNGVMAELMTLKNQNEIQDSKLEKIQQGMNNIQSNYDNSGVQIFSGPGGLLFATILVFTALLGFLFYYKNRAKINEETANLLAKRLVGSMDEYTENKVFEDVLNTNCEENVLNLIKKYK